MGQPPRLSEIQLPWETRIIYSVTLCVKDRREVLANTNVFEAMEATIAPLRNWRVLAGVIMPDHAHWIVSPIGDRECSVGDCSDGFKRVLRKHWVPNSGNGNADVLIAFCVPMRTFTANGFMRRTILCGTVWSKERKIGRII